MALATPPVIASGVNMLNMSKTAKILQNLDILGDLGPSALKMRPDILSLLFLSLRIHKRRIFWQKISLLTNKDRGFEQPFGCFNSKEYNILSIVKVLFLVKKKES